MNDAFMIGDYKVRIRWDIWAKQQFVIALGKFMSRFPRGRRNRESRRPKALWRYEP
jgi:hypothetical protein